MEKVKPVSWNASPNVACWIQLIDREPADYQHGTSAFLVKLNEVANAGRVAANQVEFSRGLADFCCEANLTIGARRLMRTDGSLLGAGPLDSRVGDEVWILAGAITPFVLRPLDGGHRQLVGEAYVHGVMHGEVVDLGLNREDITLA